MSQVEAGRRQPSLIRQVIALKQLLDRELNIEFSIRYKWLLLVSAMVLFAGYAAWSLHWFLDQGLHAIKWHTHIVFTGLIFLIPVLMAAGLFRISANRFTRQLLNIWVIVALTAITLETALVVTGISKNYMEERSGYYQSPYSQNMGNYYNIRSPNDAIVLSSREFLFRRTTNSLGFSDREWNRVKDSTTIRILTLGDSFTEGDGAPSDSAYPILLQSILEGWGLAVEILNAGTSGSDPLFCYRNLEDRLLAYAPDIVIQTVSSDDMLYDIPLRGGMERFGAHGQLQMAAPPWWEPIVAASYVLREMFRLVGLNIDRPNGAEQNPDHIRAMGKLLEEVVHKQDSLGMKYGFFSIWLVLPMKHETRDGRHVFPFEEWSTQPMNLERTVISPLLPCYQTSMAESATTYDQHFWKIDGHHNSSGYLMMAECASEQVWKIYMGDTTDTTPIFAAP